VTRLEPEQPSLCTSEIFIELASRVWRSFSVIKDYKTRINAAVAYLTELGRWLGKDGLVELKEGSSLCGQILDIFGVVRSRIPRRVFLARWYPTLADGDELERANLRLKGVRLALDESNKETGVSLELVDMGTQTGGTFPIHTAMYDAISSSDIIIVDLSGVRPNVCIEAGYALSHHEKNRLIFMFQPTHSHASVPFDLNTFRYEPFKDTGEIPGKLKPNITAIIRDASAGN
jgi:hypothetical protein